VSLLRLHRKAEETSKRITLLLRAHGPHRIQLKVI